MIDLSRIPAHHKLTFSNPLVSPCPRCGELTTRTEVRSRQFWEADLVLPTIRNVQMGCYICAHCPKGKAWFVVLPPDLQTSGQYSLTTVRIVVDLIKIRKMSAEAASDFAKNVLHLTMLDPSTILGWLVREAEASNPRLEEALQVFSGQMAFDEIYDGGHCQLVATDPIANRQLDYELLDHPATEEDVRSFCNRLKAAGFSPVLVVTDGSNLYPSVLAEVWPNAEHQRCVFHFIKQINEELGRAFWAAYATMPKPKKRKPGRPKKRGRPRQDGRKQEDREAVKAVRYLFVTRDMNLDEKQNAKLQKAMDLCAPLRTLRRFVLAIHALFGRTTTSVEEAESQRNAILADAEFIATPDLKKSLDHLRDDDLFKRLTRYLNFENAEKTSNHVERENREYRKRQKGCYRLRSFRNIRALASLLRDRVRPKRAFTQLRRRPSALPAEEVSATH